MNTSTYNLPGVKTPETDVAKTPARALNTGGVSEDTGERTVGEVLAGSQVTAILDELDAELADLRRTLAVLGAADEQELSADQFLELLRQKARLLEQPGETGEALNLAEAIRRELQAG